MHETNDGDSCFLAKDGVCDEPEDCANGTDTTDCDAVHETDDGDSCFSAKDGFCDEPEDCANGTDTTDCRPTSPSPSGSNNDTPAGSDAVHETDDGDSCFSAKDGFCDEPEDCANGTDTTDCRPTSPSPSGSNNDTPAGSDAVHETDDGDSCSRAKDGFCDEPEDCAEGTDTTDCDTGERRLNSDAQFAFDADRATVTALGRASWERSTQLGLGFADLGTKDWQSFAALIYTTLALGVQESRTNHSSSLDNNTLMDWQKWTLNDARTFTSASAKALNKEMSALLNTSTADLIYFQAEVSAGQEDTLAQLHRMLTGTKSRVESLVASLISKTEDSTFQVYDATSKAIINAPNDKDENSRGKEMGEKAFRKSLTKYVEPLLIGINAVSAESNAFLRSEGKAIQNSLKALEDRLASSGNRLKGKIGRTLSSVRNFLVFFTLSFCNAFDVYGNKILHQITSPAIISPPIT